MRVHVALRNEASRGGTNRFSGQSREVQQLSTTGFETKNERRTKPLHGGTVLVVKGPAGK
jgi:hypothetical protein